MTIDYDLFHAIRRQKPELDQGTRERPRDALRAMSYEDAASTLRPRPERGPISRAEHTGPGNARRTHAEPIDRDHQSSEQPRSSEADGQTVYAPGHSGNERPRSAPMKPKPGDRDFGRSFEPLPGKKPDHKRG